VDVTPLNIHDTIHVSQLAVRPGVRVCFDADATVVAVLPPTSRRFGLPRRPAWKRPGRGGSRNTQDGVVTRRMSWSMHARGGRARQPWQCLRRNAT